MRTRPLTYPLIVLVLTLGSCSRYSDTGLLTGSSYACESESAFLEMAVAQQRIDLPNMSALFDGPCRFQVEEGQRYSLLEENHEKAVAKIRVYPTGQTSQVLWTCNCFLQAK